MNVHRAVLRCGRDSVGGLKAPVEGQMALLLTGKNSVASPNIDSLIKGSFAEMPPVCLFHKLVPHASGGTRFWNNLCDRHITHSFCAESFRGVAFLGWFSSKGSGTVPRRGVQGRAGEGVPPGASGSAK
jgi:hypothetical protein